YSMAYAIFPAVGPALSLYLVGNVSYNSVFILCAGLAFIALGAAAKLRFNQEPRQARPRLSAFGRLSVRDFYEPRAFGVSLIVFLTGAANSGILTFLPVIAVVENGKNTVSFYFLAYSLCAVVSRL